MPVALIEGVPFEHNLPDAYLKRVRKEIDLARRTTKKLTQNLIQSIQSCDQLAKQEAVTALLTDQGVKLVSALSANRKLAASKRKTLDECLEVSTTLDLWHPITEPVRVWPIMKSNGGYRMIHDHGLRHRTAQHLVKRVLDVFFVPRSFQYTHLGYQAAIQQTKAFITQGYVHVAHLDITDFFGSFELEKLLSELPFKQATAGAPSNGGLPPQSGKGKGLPLPHEVVEHVVTGRHMAVRLKLRKNPYWNSPLASSAQLLDTARLGIPQGSACSSVVAAYTVSGLEWSPTPDVKLVNLADDFLLLAKSPELCAEETDALAEAIGKLPGGTFKLKLKTATEASNGFQFLGHHIQLVDGSLQVTPTLAADEDLVGKLDDLEVKLGEIVFLKLSKTVEVDKKAAIQSLAKSVAILTGWKSAFSQCSDIDGFIAPYVDTLSWWLDEIGATVDDLKQAISPDMEYTPSFYALGK